MRLKIVRLNLEFDKATMRDAAKVQRLLRATSITETFRRSIGIAKFTLTAKPKTKRVIVIT